MGVTRVTFTCHPPICVSQLFDSYDKNDHRTIKKDNIMGFKKLTLEDIESFLGAGKKVGNNYQWQCPYCLDKHKNNLSFNPTKGILWCFASSGEHSKLILKEIWQNKKDRNFNNNIYFKPVTKSNDNEKKQVINVYTPEKQEEMLIYQSNCNDYLLKNELLLNKLKTVRGINKDTVCDCFIGFDFAKNSWVIPSFEYGIADSYIIGHEFRPADFSKKILRSVGTPLNMCMINSYTPLTEVLAIVEGYMDGYALYQHLKELNQIQYYHIVTPCNGVGSLIKQISIVNFDKYKTCYLYIDNDKAGNETAAKLLELYPFMKRVNMNCDCKDFNEHYLKCIKNNI